MLTTQKKEQLVEDFEKWWNHELKRPIIQITLKKKENHKCASRGELLNMLYDFHISEKDVAKEYRQSLENNLYIGDSFPVFYMRSTGILGAMLGQSYNIDIERGTIWFQEFKEEDIENIHLSLKDNHPLYLRALRLLKAFQEEFGDDIGLGIPNLGGMMDIVESIRGANNCLIDLYDSPEDIIRLNNEIYEAYKKVYTDSIHAIDKNKVLGYTGWITLLSQKPYFISQCDFCCMISLDMFDEFVSETLKKEAQYIERSFYHLDGPGAIKHLDRIIECGFNGIQWVNGAGNKPFYDPIWNDIYKKIYDAGLLMQLNLETKEDFIVIDYLYDLLGDISHCAFTFSGGNEEDIEYYREYLNKYGVKE